MNITIGSARIDERGKLSGGASGDQKQTSSTNDLKGEVSMQPFYVHTKGWVVLRLKDAKQAAKVATAMKNACNNKNIGYDQMNRLEIVKMGTKTKQATECDCSSLVRQCVKEATGTDAGNFTTVNEVTYLTNTELFEKPFDYTKDTVLKSGDILVTKTKGHTAIVVDIDAKTTTKKDTSWKGVVTAYYLNVRKGAGKDTELASFGPLEKGSKVTVIGSKKASNGVVWYKIETKDGTGYVSSEFVTKE